MMTSIQNDFNRAVACHQAGDFFKAEDLYHKILTKEPAHTPTLNMLGILLHVKGNSSKALKLLTSSLEENPDQFIAENNMGVVLKDLGRSEEAISHFKTAIQIKPIYPDAHYNLANIFLATGNTIAATSHYLIVIEQKPGHVGARINLGNAYIKQQAPDKAVAVFMEALALDSENAAIYNNLGLALEAQKKSTDAILCYQKSLSLNPQAVDSYNNLGNLYTASGQSELATYCFEKALEIDPSCAGTYYNYSRLLQQAGQFEEAITASQKALNLQPKRSDIHSNLIFTMQYNPSSSAEDISLCARNWSRSLHTPSSSASFKNIPTPSRRLKIGYVSGDFLNHPVGYFLDPILENHNPNTFDIYCYSNTPPHQEDDLTERFRAQADHWRMITCMDDAEATSLIMKDQIDILIDLSGHTGRNRLPLFAQRLAPVQVGWIGSCATTGLETMDYILADSFVIPKEDESLFSEHIWRLPQNYLCFNPPKFDVSIHQRPSLENPHITFGCYNNCAKVTDEMIALWAKILIGVPDSRMVFRGKMYLDPAVQNRFIDQFVKAGIDKDRISMRGSLIRSEFLATYNEIDISLDPFPFGGGATTAESIWMGVPVITLRSDRWAGRVSESLLETVQQPHLIAKSPDDYLAIACKLAHDTARLDSLRHGLRSQLESSPFCDGPAFTNHLETAFRHMWYKWCEDQ